MRELFARWRPRVNGRRGGGGGAHQRGGPRALGQGTPPGPSGQLCGDGICDAAEQAIWIFEGSAQNGPGLRETLGDPRNELNLSLVSLLEIVIKHGLGKLPLPKAPSRLIPVLARKHMIDELPLSAAAIYGLEQLPPLHRDPFDRLLVAQCQVHGMQLVTPDPLIRQYQVPCLWKEAG